MTMPALEALVRRLARGFEEAKADFALVGGVAIGVRLDPRFTRDVDFAVAVADDEQAEAVLAYFIRYGFMPQTELTHAQTDRLHTMRLATPRLPEADPQEAQPIADLLFATTGIEREIVAEASPAPVFPGLTLPTARIPHLIAMKLLSESDDRLQDRIDLQHLVRAATDADLAEVPPLLALITQRGYDRNKDLLATLDAYLRKR
ncbi:MAG: nucleotidyl transferase AbiEii/AbiGii toxin family protein [Phycisphaeraceae bacterium]